MATILQVQNIDREELKQLLRELLTEEFSKLKDLLPQVNGPPLSDTQEQMLSMKSAAYFLQITTVTLHKYTVSGDIAVCKVGKRRRYRKSDLIKYLQQRASK
jgi:hypothetical protein